jgi:hypothetical protein
MELKKINFDDPQFIANGTHYQVQGFLSIERYCEFQILEKELGYGLTFNEMYKHLDTAEKLLNKTNFVGAAVHINNIKQGILKVQEREPVILKICALFINADDEDIKTINGDMVDKKIKDWKTEGMDMNSFFLVAVNSVNGFLGAYQNITRSITGILEGSSKVPKDEKPAN